MLNSVDFSGKPFHFIGIGGIGMSALAYVLAKRHLPVSGSDIHSSHITQRLQAVGAHIFGGQDATNIEYFQITGDNRCELLPTTAIGISPAQELPIVETGNLAFLDSGGGLPAGKRRLGLPQVICSTAINTANSEYRAAIERGCPIFHRSDLLAALIRDYESIAIAGTHGKTTTSSMIGYLLLQAGLDPTIVVGGEVNAWGGNARLGQGPYLVAEADESDGSLVNLSATIGVITNIELDHPDHYETLEQVINTFQIFAQRCKTVVGCIDDVIVRDSLQPTISYSLQRNSGADYAVDEVTYGADGTRARVWERGNILGQLNLKLLGKHNLSNALAAVAVGRKLGLDFKAIALAIATFEGARRRFELRGECNGILFVDDYAHHPSEISATLAAARLHVETTDKGQSSPVATNKNSALSSPRYGSSHAHPNGEVLRASKVAAQELAGQTTEGQKMEKEGIGDILSTPGALKTVKRIVAIFQPHRYSRARTFLQEFAQSFGNADIVVVTDIYSAGEPKSDQVTSAQVAELIATHHPRVYYQPSLSSVCQFLTSILSPGDLALFLGAGNLNQIIPQVMAFYQKTEELNPES